MNVIKKVNPGILLRLFNVFYWKKKVPEILKKCRTVLIPKGKVVSDDTSKWRPLTIGSILLRLCCKILNDRIKVPLSNCQRAFTPKDGCWEKLVLLRSIIDDVKRKKKVLCDFSGHSEGF